MAQSSEVAAGYQGLASQYNNLRDDALGAVLTNKSGGERSAGDVAVQDTSNDSGFTTTTTEADEKVIGVVAETIANDASGLVQRTGTCTVNVDAATSRGDWLVTSTTAGKATPKSTFQHGVFAVALTSSAGAGTVTCLLLAGALPSQVRINDLTIASEAQGDLIYHGGSAWARLGAGTSGQFLKTQGAGADPAWADLDIALNKVKLPTPETSDYVSPSAASESSATETLLDSQTQGTGVYNLYSSGYTRVAQRKTVNDEVSALEFELYKVGSPSGNVYFRVRKISDDSVLAEKNWGDAANLQTSATWEKATFDSPVTINQEVRLCVEYSGGDSSNYVRARARLADVKSGEYLSEYSGSWTDQTSLDLKYKLYGTLNGNKTKDDDTATYWEPSPANESGAWCRWDTGALKILGGCRIYWGSDAAYRPTAYTLAVSDDDSSWTTVETLSSDPGAGWQEYTWNARYARYVKLTVSTHGSSGIRIYEFDYYSRITDRVAAEHGHGSGVTPAYQGHGIRRGFTLVEQLGVGDSHKRIQLLERLLPMLLDEDPFPIDEAAAAAERAAIEEAQSGMRDLPGWADWTAAQAEGYIDAQVTDLASAKSALKAMAKAIVYLRDQTLIAE